MLHVATCMASLRFFMLSFHHLLLHIFSSLFILRLSIIGSVPSLVSSLFAL